jgi:hypothetical protein
MLLFKSKGVLDMSKDPCRLDMFHRALIQGDSQAREWVQRSYRKTVLHWLHNHPHKVEIYRFYDENYYVSQTFAHFWQAAADKQGLKFDTLDEALQYLYASLNGVLVDTLRASSHGLVWPEEDLNDSAELWKTIQELISDVRQQRLAYLLYHCGLKPGEIVRTCPREFSSVQEISRLRCDILEQLLHNSNTIGHWLGSGQVQV